MGFLYVFYRVLPCIFTGFVGFFGGFLGFSLVLGPL